MRDRQNSLYLATKRLFDIFLGSLSLAISSPVILLAALAIRLESPGNPFFLQTRVGLKGRPFTIFKLRGMQIDARDRFPELYDYRQFTNLDFYFHYEHDPRITRVGQFIRRTSIDELPNFLNVVMGSMTLVGPRPDIPGDVDAVWPESGTLYFRETRSHLSFQDHRQGSFDQNGINPARSAIHKGDVVTFGYEDLVANVSKHHVRAMQAAHPRQSRTGICRASSWYGIWSRR